MRRPFFPHGNPSIQFGEETQAPGRAKCGRFSLWKGVSRAVGIVWWVELVDPIQVRGSGPRRAEVSIRKSPDSSYLLLYVTLSAFLIKVANWWPEAQCCPQICFDWVVLCLKEINQHLKMWRFHRSIHSDFLLLSRNKWAELGLLGPSSCLVTILVVRGGGCSSRGDIFILAPLRKSPTYVPAGPGGLGILIAVGLFTQCPASLRLSVSLGRPLGPC